MAADCFHTLNLTQFLRSVEDLHRQVAKGHGRVEITRDGCDDVCVLISKSELEALERALEILSDTSDFRAMCKRVASTVAASLDGEPLPSATIA